MHVNQTAIVLSNEDWFKIINVLDVAVYGLTWPITGLTRAECQDYSDTLYNRVQAATLRVRSRPVPSSESFNGGTPCPCTVCSKATLEAYSGLLSSEHQLDLPLVGGGPSTLLGPYVSILSPRDAD